LRVFEMSKLVRNEQCRLRANYYNGIAIAAIGVGGLAQAASMVQTEVFSPGVTVFVVICMLFSYVLHFRAKTVLAELEE
jgi:hypothetical protein